jgi:outer membrane protein OmpA-like peptidoglycan-associated protein
MSVQNQDEGERTAFAVLIPLIVLVVGFVVGLGIHKAKGPAPKPAAAAAVAEPAPAPAEATDEARVVVDNGVVKFYFASGKADLAAGGKEALADAVQAALAGKKLSVSGFHDETGSPEQNAELAKQRALAVRDALVAAGVAEASVELKKPEVMMAGSNAEARRVEVSVQ